MKRLWVFADPILTVLRYRFISELEPGGQDLSATYLGHFA